MMRLTITLMALLQFLYIPSSYADASRGAGLEEKNCSACHAGMFSGNSDTIYLRENRRVKSYSQLISQVKFCTNNLGFIWFDEQIMDVVEYLNQSHYKFNPQN